MVYLNLDIPDILRRRSCRDQPENRGLRDDCCFLQDEIIGCLGLGLPGLGRRESAPSRPLGLPVAKENEAAHTGVARLALKTNAAPIKLHRNLQRFAVVVIPFKRFLNLFILPSFLSSEFLDCRQSTCQSCPGAESTNPSVKRLMLILGR